MNNNDIPLQETYFNREWREERQREESEPHWYAVCVTANHERKIVDLLNDQTIHTYTKQGREYTYVPPQVVMDLCADPRVGFRAYVPICVEIRQWSDRKKKVQVVQTPGIIFVRTCLRDRNLLFKVSHDHIRWFFRTPGGMRPQPIPDDAMADFMALTAESEKVAIAEASTFVKGDKVRILDGALAGRVFYINGATAPDAQGVQKVEVLIDLFGGQASVHTLSSNRVIKVDRNAVDMPIERYK